MINAPIIVIGGGISGLAVACELKRLGNNVLVLEASPRSGGKIASLNKQGFVMESAAAMLSNFQGSVDDFLDNANLTKDKIVKHKKAEQSRYLYINNKLQKFHGSMLGMLLSPIWSFKGRIRILAEILIPKRPDPDETIAEFVRRRFGNELLEKALEPYISGTLANDPEKANAWTVLPRLTMLENKFGRISLAVIINKLRQKKTARDAEVFSFRGGMQRLTDQLANYLGDTIMLDHRVESISQTEGGWQLTVKTKQGERVFQCRKLVLASPAPIASKLTADVNPELATLLSNIHYSPLNLVHLGYKKEQINHALDANGFLVPKRGQAQFNGNLWMSSIFQDRAPKGHVLLTTYLGGSRLPELCQLSDAEAIALVKRDLEPLLGIEGEPTITHVDRHQHGLPQYYGAYYERLAHIKALLRDIDGLELCANYMDGVSVRDRLVSGMALASKLSAETDENPVKIPAGLKVHRT